MRVQDKVIILTGASSGIGRAAALRLAQEGAKVVALARRKERLDELKNEAKDFPGEILPFAGDVSKDEDLKAVVQLALDSYGRIDGLINNAGVLDRFKTAHDTDDELWSWVMDINVTAPMKLIREVIPHMMEQKSGCILNVASVGGLHGGRGGISYVTSKHAVVGMSKHIGFEYQEYGIRCNALAPGSVMTEISEGQKDINEDVYNRLMKGVSILPVAAQAEEIANVILFLMSDEASFVNGATLVADGGWTAF